jgi:hypothetical protein
MAGGDPVGAERARMVEERAELDLAVAEDVQLGVRPARSRAGSARTPSRIRRRSSPPRLDSDDVGNRRRVDQSARDVQYSSVSSSSQFFMNRPTTS